MKKIMLIGLVGLYSLSSFGIVCQRDNGCKVEVTGCESVAGTTKEKCNNQIEINTEYNSSFGAYLATDYSTINGMFEKNKTTGKRGTQGATTLRCNLNDTISAGEACGE